VTNVIINEGRGKKKKINCRQRRGGEIADGIDE
jgi:hypothetical protein